MPKAWVGVGCGVAVAGRTVSVAAGGVGASAGGDAGIQAASSIGNSRENRTKQERVISFQGVGLKILYGIPRGRSMGMCAFDDNDFLPSLIRPIPNIVWMLLHPEDNFILAT
jgi:hypothetical protein